MGSVLQPSDQRTAKRKETVRAFLEMAHTKLLLIAAAGFIQNINALTTCPGFPGYCSESFPGQTCNVVCSFGRNNVPLCQDDGTWTDIPRCIEHEPGVDEQIPGMCPGIPGYCAQGFLNHRCKFDCRTGPDIDSVCGTDGTWQPYPVCEGDLRETRDGCNGCPGPVGKARNRTAEAIQGILPTDKARVPRIGSVDGGRKKIPTFAGQTSFGVKDSLEDDSSAVNNFILGSDGKIQQRQPSFTQQQQPTFRQPAQRPRQQPTQRPRPQPTQRPRPQPTQRPRPQPTQRPRPQPTQRQQQPAFRQPSQQPSFPFSQPNQGRPQPQTARPAQPVASNLFNQIKDNINAGNNRQQRPSARPTASASIPVQNFFPSESSAATSGPAVGQDLTFGPFEAVDFNNNLAGLQRQRAVPSKQPKITSRPSANNGFFGEFQSVNLQG